VAKKKHLRQNISPSGTVVPGGLIKRATDSFRNRNTAFPHNGGNA